MYIYVLRWFRFNLLWFNHRLVGLLCFFCSCICFSTLEWKAYGQCWHLNRGIAPRKILYVLEIISNCFMQHLCITSVSLTHRIHGMARANLNKSVWLVTNFTTESKYIPRRTRISINWNPPFQTSLHKIFKNCFLWSKSCFTIFTFRGTFTK